MRVKRLLQVEQLVRRRDASANLGGIHVRVGRADDDLNLLVHLTDLPGRPDTVRARRHAHVEECHGEWTIDGAGLTDCRYGGLRVGAVDRVKGLMRSRYARHECGIAACYEQAGTQLVERGAIGAGRSGIKYQPVCVEHRLFVVDDEDANLRFRV